MSKAKKLKTLLRPKDYISDIGLYCNDNPFSITSFEDLKLDLRTYNKQIKIEEL